MAESEHDVAVHNAAQLVEDIVARLEIISHERKQILGLLDDLAVYLPGLLVGDTGTCVNCGDKIHISFIASPRSVVWVHEDNHTVCNWHSEMGPTKRVAVPA